MTLNVGVDDTIQQTGVGSIEELSNIITSTPFQINPDLNTYAWTGTAGASTSTCTTPQGVLRTNLCTNGGFERGTTGWSGGNSTIAQDTSWAADGGQTSLKVTPTGGSNDTYAEINLSGLSSGQSYTVSADLRLTAPLTGSLESRAFGLNLYDGTTQTNAPGYNDEGEQRLTLTVTPASTTLRVRLYNGSSNTAQSVWWDNVTIEKTSSDKGYFDGDSVGFAGAGITAPTDGVLQRTNLCTNPSFETNTTGWSASGTGSSITRIAVAGYVGTALLSLNGTSGGNVSAIYAATGLTSGVTYTASGYVKVGGGSPTLSLLGGSSMTPTSTWTQVSTTFVASGTTKNIDFKITGTGIYSVVIDAVQLEVGSTATSYFDGNTNDTDSRIYAWTGTTNNSTSTETATYTEVAVINDATEFDQILLTKDSNPGIIAIEDPIGQAVISDPGQVGGSVPMRTFSDDDYQSIDMRFPIEDVTNVLTLWYYQKIKKGKKQTARKKHSVVYTTSDAWASAKPYAGSIAKYGRIHKSHQLHAKSDFQDYADKIFTRNADPDNVPASFTIKVVDPSKLLGGYEDGQYVGHRCIVVLPDGVTTYTCRVKRITHNITGGTWYVTVHLRDQNLHTHRRHGHKSTAQANNEDGTILGEHFDDDVDLTSKTLSNGTVQTSDDPTKNRISMYDDGSEGRIDFSTGTSGETPGQINPGIDPSLGYHYIDVRTSKAASPHDTAARFQLIGSYNLVPTPTMALLNGMRLQCFDVNSAGDVTVSGDIEGATLQMDTPPTTTSAANVRVGAGGVLNTVTSLSKHKIKKQTLSVEAVRGVLEVTPTSWFDRGEWLANGRKTNGLHRIVGAVAEDVEKHAPEFAEYDENGDLTGVDYRGLAMALIPLVRDLTDRITALEGAQA